MAEQNLPKPQSRTISPAEALAMMLKRARAGDLARAAELGEQTTRLHPDNAAAAGLMALVAQKAGNVADAEQYWQRSLDAEQSWIGGQLSSFAGGSISDLCKNLWALRRLLVGALPWTAEPGMIHKHIWEIDRMLDRNGPFCSQAGQDRFIAEHLFAKRSGGVFVDIGAHDGVTGSNTLYFEKYLNWAGLCIEAAPAHFDTLAGHRSVACVNLAVADFEGEDRFFEVTEGLHQMSGLVADMRPA